MTRWYITPEKLHNWYPRETSECWRCKKEIGTLIHILWTCTEVKPFWGRVKDIIQKFTESRIEEKPAFFLLHLSDIPIKRYENSIVPYLVNAAKACIPSNWKKVQPPSIREWVNRVEEIRRMEELIAISQNRKGKYKKIWDVWGQFIVSEEGKQLIIG